MRETEHQSARSVVAFVCLHRRATHRLIGYQTATPPDSFSQASAHLPFLSIRSSRSYARHAGVWWLSLTWVLDHLGGVRFFFPAIQLRASPDKSFHSFLQVSLKNRHSIGAWRATAETVVHLHQAPRPNQQMFRYALVGIYNLESAQAFLEQPL